ncbi:uncharacterized protein BDV17DRAFT_264968 [Aspergillus undulatus]|uniref:uncharacterized protein n=1 Tax=Aspergillus undulatus TaxID=1810928 RepID=UPI003CCE0114
MRVVMYITLIPRSCPTLGMPTRFAILSACLLLFTLSFRTPAQQKFRHHAIPDTVNYLASGVS